MPRLSVSPDGTITAIYSDELVRLNGLGSVEIERVSNVEPVIRNGNTVVWVARMKDGAVLPACATREEALAAEVEYLERKLFGPIDDLAFYDEKPCADCDHVGAEHNSDGECFRCECEAYHWHQGCGNSD